MKNIIRMVPDSVKVSRLRVAMMATHRCACATCEIGPELMLNPRFT